MEDEVVRIKVQPLTAEAFRPYGYMLETKQPLFPEVESEGRVVLELLRFKRPVNRRRISMMATISHTIKHSSRCAAVWR
jgi:hypothetical protein